MKKIMVTRSSMPPMQEYIDEIRDIWDSHWLTNMGVKHKELQKKLKEYLGVENVDLLTNGHMALELSMQALNLKGEVITTPFTFASTTHAIVRNGLEPVFCDIDPIDFTMDVSKIESLITDRTCAIVPVHVYGNVCRVEEIERIAKKYDLKVIYDAAHAFGVRYKDRGIASWGDVSCFSFHATKVFNTIEGGAVCFGDKNKDFGLDIYRLKNFGIRGPEVVDAVGANAKMNEFCAAMGLCNLRHLDRAIAARKRVYGRYTERLGILDGIKLCYVPEDTNSNYAYFPVVIDAEKFGCTRDELADRLAENGIGARKYFYPLTSTVGCLDGKNPNSTPVAQKISDNILCLPIYEDLDEKSTDYICDTIISFSER